MAHCRYGLTCVRVSHLLLHSLISVAFKPDAFSITMEVCGKAFRTCFLASSYGRCVPDEGKGTMPHVQELFSKEKCGPSFLKILRYLVRCITEPLP